MDAMNSDLKGKSVLITGASTGIGAAAARVPPGFRFQPKSSPIC